MNFWSFAPGYGTIKNWNVICKWVVRGERARYICTRTDLGGSPTTPRAEKGSGHFDEVRDSTQCFGLDDAIVNRSEILGGPGVKRFNALGLVTLRKCANEL
jgi:hypothetical protein